MSHVPYSELLKDPRWKSRRRTIVNRDRCCQICFSRRKLEVHHHFYLKDRMPWEYDDDQLTTLCRSCHELVTLAMRGLPELLSRVPVPKIQALIEYLKSIAGRHDEPEAPFDVAASIESEDHRQRELERLDLLRPINYENEA